MIIQRHTHTEMDSTITDCLLWLIVSDGIRTMARYLSQMVKISDCSNQTNITAFDFTGRNLLN